EIERDLKRDLYPDYPVTTKPPPKYLDWPNEPFIKTGYVSPRLGEIFQTWKKFGGPLPAFHDRLFFAGEHTSTDFFGYMEGALRSGIRAADRLMQQACGLLPPPTAASPAPAPPVRVARPRQFSDNL